MQEEETLAELAYLVGGYPLPTAVQEQDLIPGGILHRKALEAAAQQVQEQAKAKEPLPTWVDERPEPWYTPGSQITERMRVLSARPYDNKWGGQSALIKLVTADGRHVHWWSSSKEWPAVGRWYWIRATVKSTDRPMDGQPSVQITKACAVSGRYGRKVQWSYAHDYCAQEE